MTGTQSDSPRETLCAASSDCCYQHSDTSTIAAEETFFADFIAFSLTAIMSSVALEYRNEAGSSR
jgi:hypothetical protein